MNSFTAEELLKANKKYYEKIMVELENNKKGLVKLDNWRNELPEVLKVRYKHDPKELSINSLELVKLMEWKLRKGKFRPMLKKLIGENKDDFVIQTTKDAFKLILNFNTEIDEDGYTKVVREAINILNGLRGVGPATSSLILSLLHKITKLAPPFYSDEAAWFVFGDEKKLNYSLPEYIKYLRIFYKINPLFKYDFSDLEKGAWSLQLRDEFKFNEEDIKKLEQKEKRPFKELYQPVEKRKKAKIKSELMNEPVIKKRKTFK